MEAGDEILISGLSYPPYISFVKYFGAKPVEYKTAEDDGWQPDVDDLASKLSDKTKAVVIINPNNPTGAAYPAPVLQKMLDVIAPYNRLRFWKRIRQWPLPVCFPASS